MMALQQATQHQNSFQMGLNSNSNSENDGAQRQAGDLNLLAHLSAGMNPENQQDSHNH